MAQKYYVGSKVSNGDYERFKADSNPTKESHGHLYRFVIGPFITKRGASFMANYGKGNPHLQIVAECEKIAKIYQNSEG